MPAGPGSDAQARSVVEDVRALGDGEAEAVDLQRRILLEAVEAQHRDLTEGIMQFHRHRRAVLQADADAVEGGVAALGDGFQPLQTIPVAGILEGEVLFQVIAAEQDRRRRGAERVAQLLGGDLVQILVVDEEFFAIGLDHLFIGFLVGPDELARTREHEAAAGGVEHLGGAVLGPDHALGEAALGRLRAADELLELVQRGGRGAPRRQCREGDGACYRQRRQAGGHQQAAQVETASLRAARAHGCSGIVHVVRFHRYRVPPRAAAFRTGRSSFGVGTARPRRHQDFTVAIGLHGRYQTALLHLFQQPRGAVVADAQVTLHQRDRSPAMLEDHGHGLVVHLVALAATSAGSGRTAAAIGVFEHATF